MNPAFEIGRNVGNNLGKSFQKVKDENAIERILSEAMNTGDPAVLQNSIGKILSQVSPERQGLAVQYLQNTFNTLQQKQEKERKSKAVQAAGLNPDLPEALQKVQYENQFNDQRAKSIMGGAENASNASSQNPQQRSIEGGLKALTDDQLIQLSGVKGYAESAKQQLKANQEERKLDQKKNSKVFEHELNRSSKILEKSDQIAETLPQKRTALNLMKDAIANKNFGFFSGDNLAELTGIEAFRSPEGSIFKTAGKEYFLGSIARAGARPNQWIEQQIQDMMTKIGRSTEANLSVARALENELDLEQERVRLTQEISDRLTSEGDLSQGKLGSILNKEMMQFATKKQDELFNDLRAIKAIGEKTPQKFRKIENGTPISQVVVQALLRQFNNDPKKAADEAKKLGYSFE